MEGDYGIHIDQRPSLNHPRGTGHPGLILIFFRRLEQEADPPPETVISKRVFQ